MAESGVFGADEALADAETRWREIATGSGSGSGGTGDSSNPSPAPDVLSGFVISGGHGFSGDDSSDSFGGLVPAEDAHYYHGFWAGIQAAMYAPQPLPSAPAPYPIPGYGPNEPFPIPRANPLESPNEVSKAATSVNPFPWGRREHIPWGTPFGGPVGPFDSVPFLPWQAPWDHPPWVLPEEWPQIVDPYTSASLSTPGFSPIKGKLSDVSPFPQYLSPGQLQQYQDVNPELAPDANPDDFSPFMVETFGEATGQVSAPIGIDPFTGSADADITPGNVSSDVTPRGD